MKHFDKNKTGSVRRPKKRPLAFLLLFIYIFSAIITLLPASTPKAAAAANNATQGCIDLTSKGRPPSSKLPANHPFVKACIKGYNLGYNDPNSPAHGCPIADTWCLSGYTLGAADKKKP